MNGFFQWVRTNSQKYLLEAVQAELAHRYLGRPPTVGPRTPQVMFWKFLFVPLYRRHVFAQIKPATQKRIDLGFALGEEPFTSRLHDTGGLAKKDRITHKIEVGTRKDVNAELLLWLRKAYRG